MKSRIFKEIEKTFSGVSFEAQPTTQVVMVESLKMYRSVLQEMYNEALNDYATNRKSTPAYMEAVHVMPRIRERLARCDRYIRNYSLPINEILIDATRQDDLLGNDLAVCRIKKCHKVDVKKVEVLHILKDGENITSNDPRVIILAERGYLVRDYQLKSGTVEMKMNYETGLLESLYKAENKNPIPVFEYSQDSGETWKPIPEQLFVNEVELKSLKYYRIDVKTDKRICSKVGVDLGDCMLVLLHNSMLP